MWELRLILVLIGVVIITGVYLLSRQNRKRSEKQAGLGRKSPVFNKDPSAADELEGFSPDDGSTPHRDEHTDSSAAVSKEDRLILALHVAARDGIAFAGTRVLETLQANGLKFGAFRIFHRLFKGDPQKSVFSVANMLEPGAFDPDALSGQEVSGLTLFLVLPGPQDGVDAYADMLATARHLAQHLGGEVLDETRSTLTRQTARHIRERIIEFQRHVQLRQRG